MQKFAFAFALALSALLPFAFAAAPGGKACQVAESGVPTPGLAELVMGSKTDPLPNGVQLSAAQIDKLYELDNTLRGRLSEIEARARELPRAVSAKAPAHGAKTPAHGAQAPAACEVGKSAELPALVADFLAPATRDAAILIDAEQAIEFRLARKGADAKSRDENSSCELCLAVRRGMERPFAWTPRDFGELNAEQAKEAKFLAEKREEVRRAWSRAIASELTPAQLDRLRRAQMGWLKSTLAETVEKGLVSLGAATCSSCKAEVQVKCEFCGIVEKALERARASL